MIERLRLILYIGYSITNDRYVGLTLRQLNCATASSVNLFLCFGSRRTHTRSRRAFHTNPDQSLKKTRSIVSERSSRCPMLTTLPGCHGNRPMTSRPMSANHVPRLLTWTRWLVATVDWVPVIYQLTRRLNPTKCINSSRWDKYLLCPGVMDWWSLSCGFSHHNHVLIIYIFRTDLKSLATDRIQ